MSESSAVDAAPLRILAVCSGKGGVGKTNFTINFALALREAGQRVVVLDADLGMANVNVALGMPVRASLVDVVSGEKRLAEVMVEGPGGILVIPGGSGVQELANLDEAGRAHLVGELATLGEQADVLLIDTAAGISRNVLAFASAAETVLVVTIPEPPAIADAYGMVKALIAEKQDADVRLVVNRTLRPFEGKAVHEKVNLVVQRFLGANVVPFGSIPDDETVPNCVRIQKPFFLHSPSSPSARAVRGMAQEFARQERAPSEGVGGFLDRLLRWFR